VYGGVGDGDYVYLEIEERPGPSLSEAQDSKRVPPWVARHGI
jgi:hypothetical protein